VALKLHPATNRDYEMYLAVKARAVPILGPKLVIDTDQNLDAAVQNCVEYIRG
jgi:hypothetical protein